MVYWWTKNPSSTTNFLTVLHASAASSNEKSLNDVLYAGPKLKKGIVEIISHFWLHAVPVVANITKMYWQIGVHPDHQPFQTILWRKSINQDIQKHVLTTVTYGVTSSHENATSICSGWWKNVSIGCQTHHGRRDCQKQIMNFKILCKLDQSSTSLHSSVEHPAKEMKTSVGKSKRT